MSDRLTTYRVLADCLAVAGSRIGTTARLMAELEAQRTDEERVAVAAEATRKAGTR